MALFAFVLATPLASNVALVSHSEPAPDAKGKLCGYSSIQEGGFVVELYTNPCTDVDQAEHFQTVYNKYCTLCLMFAVWFTPSSSFSFFFSSSRFDGGRWRLWVGRADVLGRSAAALVV